MRLHHSAVVFAFAATVSMAAFGQSSLSFELSRNLNATYAAGLPVVGDFNGDGKPDRVTASRMVSLEFGNGDGTFKPAILIANVGQVNEEASDFAAADLNGDGKLDLVYITNLGNLKVLFGNGDGTFQAAMSVPTIYFPESIALGDFNSDGLGDIAVGDIQGNVEILTNTGGKTFALSTTTAIGNEVVRVRAGDVDANGTVDLAVQTFTSAYVLWGSGNGVFRTVKLGDFANPQIGVGDLNQDGNADIMVSYSCASSTSPGAQACNAVDVFYGQGNQSTFHRAVVMTPGVNVSPMFAADVNGDGLGDLVTETRTFNNSVVGLLVWLGHPDGSFDQTPQRFTFSSDGGGTLALGDFNRDGMIDFTDGGELFLNASNRAACAVSAINPTVTVCQPVEGTYSPTSLRIVANAYDTTTVTALQEYIDYKLVYSQDVTSFDISMTESLGPHLLVTKAWDAKGVSFRSNRHINVYDGTPGPVCYAAPGAAAMCLPATGTTSSPVHVLANASTSAVPTAVQLYVDGSLVINNTVGGTTYLDTYQTLSSGTHLLVFKVFDANGNALTAGKSITVQ